MSHSAGRVVQNLKRYRPVKSRAEHKSALGTVPIASPRMNWEPIREAKVRMCAGCLYHGYWTDGCLFNLIPDMKCSGFRGKG